MDFTNPGELPLDEFRARLKAARREISAKVSSMLDNEHQLMVLGAMIFETVNVAYNYHYGNRAEARDMVSEGIDMALNDIDTVFRELGVHSLLVQLGEANKRQDYGTAAALVERIKAKAREGNGVAKETA